MKTVILFTLSSLAWAQVRFDVGPDTIGENEAIQFKITVSGTQASRNVTFPKGLNPGAFKMVSQNPSTQTRTSIFNGQVTNEQSYTYQFMPTKQGELTFPAQSVQHLGKIYESQPKRINVGPPIKRQTRRTYDPFDDLFGRRSTQRQMQPEIEVRAHTEKKTYYVGEPISLSIRLYLRGISIDPSNSGFELPDFTGFWVEEQAPVNRRTKLATLDGKQWDMSVVDERRLYANKPGTITIPAAEFDLMAISGVLRRQRVLRQTEPIELTIIDIPRENRPANFNGLVGSFNLDASIDKNNVAQMESVSVQVTLSGFGRHSIVSDVRPENLDPSIEIFDGGPPKTITGQGGSNLGYIAEKSWVYALVPHDVGNFEIPAIALSYFDPQKKRFVTRKAGPFTLEVSPGASLPPDLSNTANQEPLIVEDASIHYIKLDDSGAINAKRVLRHPEFLLRLIIIALLLQLLLFVSLYLYRYRIQRLEAYRPRFAYRHFKRSMQKLGRTVDHAQPDTFYATLSQNILNYFGDRWERAGAGLSLDQIEEKFQRMHIDPSHHQALVSLIEGCDLARFTPSNSASRAKLLEQARTTIAQIEGALK